MALPFLLCSLQGAAALPFLLCSLQGAAALLNGAGRQSVPDYLRYQSKAFLNAARLTGQTPTEAKVVCDSGVCELVEVERAHAQKWVETPQVFSGVCKWYSISKGYGFLTTLASKPGDEGGDIFVHQSDLCSDGVCVSLIKGEELEFRIAESVQTGRRKAAHVTGPGGASLQVMDSQQQPRPSADSWSYIFDDLFSP